MRSKALRRLLGVGVSAALAIAALAPAAQAQEPAAGYSAFAGCPSPTENPAVTACTRSVITGGHFQIGSKDVPITNPITLSGGLAEGGAIFANSKGGLTPVKQKVPGGIIGLTGLTWLAELLGSEALTLYAVTELVGQPILGETFSLPVRVHLVNPVLGNSCYVGSVSNPISLHLTTGTTSPPPPNKPITGSEGEIAFDPTLEILHQNHVVFVDNSFAAPGASGCVLTLFGFIPINLNPLVNAQSGLPSAAGHNATSQNLNLELVGSNKVYP
jgi:hypothetical protein